MHVVYWIIPSNSDWSSPKVLVVWKVTVKWHCRFLYIFSQWIPDPIFSVHEWKEAYFLFPLSQTQPAIWKPSRVLLTSCLITSNKDPASRVFTFLMMKIHSNLVFTFDFIPLIISGLFPVNRKNIARANIWIGRGHFYEAMCQSITVFHRDLLMCQEKIDMWKILKFGFEFLGLKYQFEIASELDPNASRESHCFVRIEGKKKYRKKKWTQVCTMFGFRPLTASFLLNQS